MTVHCNNDDSGCRETAFQRLMEALRRDAEGQRELIAARARGETAAVYWKDNQRPAGRQRWRINAQPIRATITATLRR